MIAIDTNVLVRILVDDLAAKETALNEAIAENLVRVKL